MESEEKLQESGPFPGGKMLGDEFMLTAIFTRLQPNNNKVADIYCKQENGEIKLEQSII